MHQTRVEGRVPEGSIVVSDRLDLTSEMAGPTVARSDRCRAREDVLVGLVVEPGRGATSF